MPATSAPTTPAPSTPRNSSQSLRRGVQLLHAVADCATSSRGISVSELARKLDIHMSSVSRLAAPLVEEGLLRRDDSGRFQLGKDTLTLGRAYIAGLDLWQTAHDALQARTWPTDVRTQIAVPDGAQVRILTRPENAKVRRPGAHPEVRLPMHACAAGKAILAFGGPVWMKRASRAGFSELTPRTITNPKELGSDLARVRVRGYAICDRELDPALRSVAAPLRDLNGSVVGAVEVSAPAVLMAPMRLRQLAGQIVRVAREVSFAMGGPRPQERGLKAEPRSRAE